MRGVEGGKRAGGTAWPQFVFAGQGVGAGKRGRLSLICMDGSRIGGAGSSLAQSSYMVMAQVGLDLVTWSFHCSLAAKCPSPWESP